MEAPNEASLPVNLSYVVVSSHNAPSNCPGVAALVNKSSLRIVEDTIYEVKDSWEVAVTSCLFASTLKKAVHTEKDETAARTGSSARSLKLGTLPL